MQTSPIANPVTKRNIDDLEEEIISLSKHMNQDEYRFLVMIREFDIRQGWRAYQFNNCAEWLNMKCGISPGTAREKVRVALALLDLPQCSEGFAKGELSYSKVRAMTRAANVFNEATLVDYALKATAHQVEEHCRRLRNADRRQSTPDARRAWQARSLKRTCHPDGMMSIYVELPREQGELVMKALEMAMAAAAGDTADEAATNTGEKDGVAPAAGKAAANTKDKAGKRETAAQAPAENQQSNAFFARQADALVAVARGYLSGNGGEKRAKSDNYQVVVHVDAAALQDKGGKSDLPVESVRRIACDADLVAVTRDAKGNLLNLGRKHRVVSPQLKRALLARDKCCTYPSCSHEQFLEAHHVMHWADGGETSLANTMLICGRHHRLLHEGGFTIHKNFAGEWYFRTADGKVLPEAPMYKPEGYDASRDAFKGDNQVNEPRALPEAPMYKPKDYDASRDAFKGDNQVNEPRALPEAPVYKPVEYDSSRDEILEDTNKVKEPRALPEAPMYKPKGYDASRDAFKGDNQVNEPRALPEAPMYKPKDYDASRDAFKGDNQAKKPRVLYAVG